MGDDSCLRGHGFKSQRRIMDGHFFTLICCKNYIVCLKRPKINEKRQGLANFFKKKNSLIWHLKQFGLVLPQGKFNWKHWVDTSNLAYQSFLKMQYSV